MRHKWKGMVVVDPSAADEVRRLLIAAWQRAQAAADQEGLWSGWVALPGEITLVAAQVCGSGDVSADVVLSDLDGVACSELVRRAGACLTSGERPVLHRDVIAVLELAARARALEQDGAAA